MTDLERRRQGATQVPCPGAPEIEVKEPGQAPEIGQGKDTTPIAWQGQAPDPRNVHEAAQDQHAVPEHCSMPLQCLSQTQQGPQLLGLPLIELEERERLL